MHLVCFVIKNFYQKILHLQISMHLTHFNNEILETEVNDVPD